MVGGAGKIVTVPVVSPVIAKEANTGPVKEEIPTKTVPPLIDTPTCWDAGSVPFWIAVNVTLVVDTESEGPLPPPPPPPPQAARKSTIPTYAARACGVRSIFVSLDRRRPPVLVWTVDPLMVRRW